MGQKAEFVITCYAILFPLLDILVFRVLKLESFSMWCFTDIFSWTAVIFIFNEVIVENTFWHTEQFTWSFAMWRLKLFLSSNWLSQLSQLNIFVPLIWWNVLLWSIRLVSLLKTFLQISQLCSEALSSNILSVLCNSHLWRFEPLPIVSNTCSNRCK